MRTSGVRFSYTARYSPEVEVQAAFDCCKIRVGCAKTLNRRHAFLYHRSLEKECVFL